MAKDGYLIQGLAAKLKAYSVQVHVNVAND